MTGPVSRRASGAVAVAPLLALPEADEGVSDEVAVEEDVAGAEAAGIDVVVPRTPLTTETVSMRPAPFGPSTISVDSETSSLPPLPLLGDSQGIGVSNAPPRLSSLPNVEVDPRLGGLMLAVPGVTPFRMVEPELGTIACGRGKTVVVEDTVTTRSSARR